MLKGYWQVPLTSQASEISAFVTPDNFLQYTAMTFRLRNAPATFQHLVNIVLHDVPNCNMYLDDLVLYSLNWTEHVCLLRKVFYTFTSLLSPSLMSGLLRVSMLSIQLKL